MKDLSGLHVITSSSNHSHEELAHLALLGGAKIIQLREKSLPTDELLEIARRIRSLTLEHGAAFIMNDRVDIAMTVGADGVHLGQDDLPPMDVRYLWPDAIIGVSCGTHGQAIQAENDGADYIGFGHIYPTGSKVKLSPQRTLDELGEVARAVDIPVIAIGGITIEKVKDVLATGASGIAVIGAIANADDPSGMTSRFVRATEHRHAPELTGDEFGRYSRQLMLNGIGFDGQQKLKNARVCVIGAGGLGTPAALYLTATGVGTIGLVDFDTVDISNLHRQVLYTTADVGRMKVAAASERLLAGNPNVLVVSHPIRLDETNATDILSQYDIVLDGSDNFTTRYLVNDTAVALGKPVVFGSIFRFAGQVSVFGLPDGPCYRCLFPEPPDPSEVPSCAEIGVLGVLPGVIGMLQATEAIKLITGIGEPLRGRLLMYDAMGMRFREVKVRKNPDCTECSSRSLTI